MIKKAGLVAGLLVLAMVVNAQVLKDLPPVRNTIESAEYAFVTVLENIMAMDKYSYAIQQIRDSDVYNPEQTPQKYLAYINFILDNLTFDKIKIYVSSIDNIFKNFNYQALSRHQQQEVDHFLQTALIDRHSYHVGSGALDDHPIPDTVVLEYDSSATDGLRMQISSLEQELAPLKTRFYSLENPAEERTRRLYEIINERQVLNNRQNRNAAEVNATQNRLDELRRMETELREKSTPLAIEYNSLRRQIDKIERSLDGLNSRLEREQGLPKAQAETAYRRSLCENINRLQTWVDFFDGENTVIRDFLVMLEIKEHLNSIITNEIPQRLLPEYEKKVATFFESWGL